MMPTSKQIKSQAWRSLSGLGKWGRPLALPPSASSFKGYQGLLRAITTTGLARGLYWIAGLASHTLCDYCISRDGFIWSGYSRGLLRLASVQNMLEPRPRIERMPRLIS